MNTLSRARGLVLGACAVFLVVGVSAGSAFGQEAKCRDTIIKETGKYQKAQIKTLTKCNDSLLKAKDGFNGVQGRGCRDTAGKTQEKLDKATSKFLAKIDKACGGDDKVCGNSDDLDIDDPLIGWGGSGNFGNGFHGVCPDFESTGCTNIIRHCGGANSNGEGVTDCVLCIQDQVVNQTMDLLYEDLLAIKFGGGIDPVKSHNKCQQALVKASAKHVLSKSKTLGKCWASLNKAKAGFSSTDADGCVDSSGKTLAKIDKSESKKIAAICKKCGGDDKECDQALSTLQGTLVNPVSGNSDDFDPLADIGFGTACPDVTLPYTPGTDCGTLDNLGSGSTDDVIENMEEFVGCLDCVLEYKVDCADRSVVPDREAMPDECITPCVADADGQTCPTTVEILANATETRLDTGWTGRSHDFDIPSNGMLTLNVNNCDGTERPTCGECDLSGPIPNDAGPQTDNQRCRSDNSIKCTADSDCPVTDNCVFYFGVALPLSSGNVPICVTNEIVGGITGTLNVEAGTAASTISLFSRVHVGVALATPCPRCRATDPNEPDVTRCDAGPNVGSLCNVDSNSSIFGPLSYDCQPTGGIGDLDITLRPATGNQSITLSAANPLCTATGGGERCFCSTCSTADGEACSTDADCPAASTCGGDRCLGGINNGDPCGAASDCGGAPCGVPGQPTAPNGCLDATCSPNGSDPDSIDEGECAAGPFEPLCSIEKFRGCTIDDDCRPGSEGGTCPGCAEGFQTCNFVTRQCYTADGMIGDDVEVEGAADPGCGNFATPRLGTFFCVPPTEAASTNAVGGLPGLGRLDLVVETRYQ